MLISLLSLLSLLFLSSLQLLKAINQHNNTYLNNMIDKPNIIVVVLDDVGWNDLSYNSPSSQIKTPFIDSLVQRCGIYLTQHYTYPLCTPTRASLLTGRYHINTGLNYVLLPGTPAGDQTTYINMISLLINMITLFINMITIFINISSIHQANVLFGIKYSIITIIIMIVIIFTIRSTR